MGEPIEGTWEGVSPSCTASVQVAAHCDGEHGPGEPHAVTVWWFDPVAEPDCAACSDTGQVAGQPCPEGCERAKVLAGAGLELDDGTVVDATGGWWGGDDE
jgi:hypothetical protein